MTTCAKPLLALTASDLMSRDVVLVPEHLSLRAAARLFSRERISGAPVVDAQGRCVGVLSTTDFVRRVLTEERPPMPAGPYACSEWQVLDAEALPADAVAAYMTADPVTAAPSTDLRTLARMMLDAHIHRVVVVDEAGRPVGVVTATDVLAAVAGAREAG